MTPETYASNNRMSEIVGTRITFYLVSGNKRRTKYPVWFMNCDDMKRARRLAKRWAFKGQLGKPVLV
jgi:hypothetical protein